jgi:hypothetical protein
MINSPHRRTGNSVIRLQIQFGIFAQFEQIPRTCLKFCTEVFPTALIASFEVFEIIFSSRLDGPFIKLKFILFVEIATIVPRQKSSFCLNTIE